MKDLPDCFKWPVGLQPPQQSLLKESREEMYEALRLFHDHVKYVIYLMVSLPAVILIFIKIYPADKSNPPLLILSGIVLLFIPIVSLFSIQIIKKYYKVYVSALFFATKLHVGGDLIDFHPWLVRTILQTQKCNDSQDFLEMRTLSHIDTYFFYKIIIYILALLSLICGLTLILISYELI